MTNIKYNNERIEIIINFPIQYHNIHKKKKLFILLQVSINDISTL